MMIGLKLSAAAVYRNEFVKKSNLASIGEQVIIIRYRHCEYGAGISCIVETSALLP